MTGARVEHAATLLNDTTVLVAGGNAGGSAVIGTAERYKPTNGLWSPAKSMHTAREEPRATLLADGTVLVTGGYGVHPRGDMPLASAEIYVP
jgi:hypothetical protein